MASGDYLLYCVNYNLHSSFATQIFRQHDGGKKKLSVTQRFLFFHAQRFLLFVLHQHAMPHASIHCDEPRQTAAVSSLSINEVHLHHQRKRKIDIAMHRVRRSESTEPVKERGQRLCTDVRLITPHTHTRQAMNVGSKTVVFSQYGRSR